MAEREARARGDVVIEVELEADGDPTAAGVIRQDMVERQRAVPGTVP